MKPAERSGAKRPESLDEEWSFVNVDELSALSVETSSNPVERYPAKQHARSVAKQLGVETGLIYLIGQPERTYEDSDLSVIFRQRRYFYYLSGINYPGCILTYHIEGDLLWLFIPPPRSMRSVIFYGQVPSTKHFMEISDIDDVLRTTDIAQYIDFYAKHDKGQIYALHESQVPRTLDHNSSWWTVEPTLSSRFDVHQLQSAMNRARAIKSEYEVKMIRKANQISAQAHVNVLQNIHRFKNEAEIEAIFTATCIAHQAKNQAYGVIAGSGSNAGTLHYEANQDPLAGRQVVCLDAGCEWKDYASDVTRTFPISGEWSTEAKAIHDIVHRMQQACIDMVKSGTDYRKMHLQAHKVAVEGLMDIGLLYNGSFEDIYKSGVSTAFFPHGLGHYIGLEVHDVGPLGPLLFYYPMRETRAHSWSPRWFESSLAAFKMMLRLCTTDSSSNSTEFHAPRPPSILEPGHVITIEPGLYFPVYPLRSYYLRDPIFSKYINVSVLDKYWAVGGIRIEDNFLVTEDGYETLSTAPKGEEMLKIVREGWEEEKRNEKGGGKEKKGWGWLW